MTRPFLAIFALLAFAGVAPAQTTSALINEAMDKLVNLNLDATLPEAMKAIEDETAVPIRVSRAVYDALPWGDQTKLTARIEQQTLRASMTAIAARLGLQFSIGDEAVELTPMPALVRIGRRSTVDELAAVDLLGRMPMNRADEISSVADAVRGMTQQLTEAQAGFSIEDRVSEASGGFVRASPAMKAFKNQTLLEVLEEMHKQTGATWYPWGRTIVIVPKEDHVRMLLDRPVTVRFNGVDVSQVLGELSRRSGVPFIIEPGAVQRISPESRTIKLTLENVSTRQALESVAGFTGLGYVANETGIYVWNPAAATAAGRPVNRVMAVIRQPDGTEIFLSENDLPPDVKAFIEARKARAIADLQAQMKKEGFKTPGTP